MAKGKGGGLLSKQGLIRMAVGAVATIFVFNKLAQSAADPTSKGSITSKAASALGFSGPGIG